MSATAPKPLLQVEDLRIGFRTSAGALDAVRGIGFSVGRKEVLAIVGESGSGKSLSVRAIMGLLPPNATVGGSIKFQGEELVGKSERSMRDLRGARMAMIFQDPMTALNPVLSIGSQIVEAIRIHDHAISRAQAKVRAVELLELVAIPFAARRIDQYPHEFSGGMRQRATIAMAMANRPDLLSADEPTTALDVTVQAQILDVLERLRAEAGVGLVLITHDLGVAAGVADNIAVMYGGRIVEYGPVDQIFYNPRHPYTQALLASLPSLESRQRLYSIGGLPPALGRQPAGCAFHPRCRVAVEHCQVETPALRIVGETKVACHLAADLAPGIATSQTESVADAH